MFLDEQREDVDYVIIIKHCRLSVCSDQVVRVQKSELSTLLDLPSAELEVMPDLLAQGEVKLLLNCVSYSPETLGVAQFLSALHGELKSLQGRINLSGSGLRDALDLAEGEVTLTPIGPWCHR